MTDNLSKGEKEANQKSNNLNKKSYVTSVWNKMAICEEYLGKKKTGKGKILYIGLGGFILGEDFVKGGKLVYEGGLLNGKRNGKGKEYNKVDESLIYEGEFLDENKNGKGKDYYNGKVIFEGEYLKGRKWNGIGYNENGEKAVEIKEGNGKIKGDYWEYFSNSKLKIEGQYLKGEINGKVEEYNIENKLIFKGEYLNGLKMEKEKNSMKTDN